MLDLIRSRRYSSKTRAMAMYRAPRGMKDVLPGEQRYWKYVCDKAISVSQLYGYERIDTPTLEYTGLFLRSVGEETDIVEKQMYTFEDRGGDSVTLRPEGTAPVCRAYIEHGWHNLPQPVRLYYFGSIFRYERPQAGRLRQHQQFGCEAIGSADPLLDAEIVDMAWRLCTLLGLKGLTVQLNSIGCQTCRARYVQQLRDYYSRNEALLCPDCRRRLQRNPLRLLDCKNPACQKIAEEAPRILEYLCDECRYHFDTVKDYLSRLQIPHDINPHLVRGLDYYNRTVFEIQATDAGGQNALGGGGRYDGLVELLGGKPAPAVGFATGIERIILNLQRQSLEPTAFDGARVYLAHLGEEAKRTALVVADDLRRSGIGVTLAAEDRSLKAQLKQADSLGLSRAIIIGGDEISTGSAIVRDMTRGEQVRIPIDQLVSELTR